MIQHLSFKHGWFYHYRVHRDKLRQVAPSFPRLQDYLLSLFQHCPDEYFNHGPRSSKLQLPIDIELTSIPGHEVCSWAQHGLEHGQFKTAHCNVQVTMLESDNSTVAVEVPLWLSNDDVHWYSELFGSTEPLTGHIDALSVHDGNIWVWDYKPKAAKEKHAHVQTYFYAVMLSHRTGIPLNKFRCGYFDVDDCYVFNPTEVSLPSVTQ